jgi:hypothetical protein
MGLPQCHRSVAAADHGLGWVAYKIK